ncbi:MAG: Na+/H+ antiporter NhaC family protein, partial [Lachnospiraceae bacterium]|nr:Na+/H+ antiporter NhaC family protein [Lachnospiraceae bacterium]
LVLAVIGINVFLVIGVGILLFLIAGVLTGSLTYVSALTSMGNGCSGMFETMIVTILVASIGALIRENGGFASILGFIRRHFSGLRGGLMGISLLTFLMDVATANNTVAIVMAAPIARQITEEYGIDPRETASLLDTCSCIAQGIIPYGAQLLIAAGLAEISSVKIIPFLFYPFLLMVCVALSIAFHREK